MPVINGQVMRSRYTSLKLRELSSVDNPAQPGALALIRKRHEPAQPSDADLAFVAKYICESDGAHSFGEVLRENKFSQEIWPYTDALTQSIRSIVGDKQLSGDSREQKITDSVQEFLAAVRLISPEIAKSLEQTVRKDSTMPKSIEDLEKQVGELTGQLTSAQALAAAEKTRADNAEQAAKEAKDKLKTEEEAHTATKAKLTEATDEVVKFGDKEIKKSVVGETQFDVVKAMAEDRELQSLEKRAATEFQHVPGTDAEKALVLKSIASLPAENATRKALETVMAACEKMAKAGFDTLGVNPNSEEAQTAKAAAAKFDEEVEKVAKADNISRHQAMTKVRQTNPQLFAEAYPDQAN